MCTRASKEITRVKYHNLFHISSRILTVQTKMCDMFSVSLTKLDESNNMYIDTSFLCSCWCSTFSMHRDAWIMMMNIVFLLSSSFSLYSYVIDEITGYFSFISLVLACCGMWTTRVKWRFFIGCSISTGTNKCTMIFLTVNLVIIPLGHTSWLLVPRVSPVKAAHQAHKLAERNLGTNGIMN